MNHVTSDPKGFNLSLSLCFDRLLLWNVSDAVCSLERGMCTWANTQNMVRDKLDWELTNQEADKHYSIPQSDHTLGTERGNTSASHSAKCGVRARRLWVQFRGLFLRSFHVILSTQYLTMFSMFTMSLLGSFHVSNCLMVSLHVLRGSAWFSPFSSCVY